MRLFTRTALAGIVAAMALMPVSASAEGDAKAGKKVFNKCKACHSIANDKHRVGPSLKGIIGRQAGTAEGYTRYSKGMIAYGEGGIIWSEETLVEYLADPRGLVKGTRMAFAGLKKEKDSKNVTAYIISEQ